MDIVTSILNLPNVLACKTFIQAAGGKLDPTESKLDSRASKAGLAQSPLLSKPIG